jgi:hypothetical protein
VAYDSDERCFHLTPQGWVREDNEPYPADRIETWHYSMSQASGWSRERRSLSCEWATPTLTRAERDKIRKKFGWPHGMSQTRDSRISKPL